MNNLHICEVLIGDKSAGMSKPVPQYRLFFRFWLEAFKEAGKLGWAISGAVSAVIPDLIVALGKLPWEALRPAQIASWVSDNQGWARLYCVAIVFVAYLAYAPYRKCRETKREAFQSMKKAWDRLGDIARERDSLKSELSAIRNPQLIVSYEETEDCLFPVKTEVGPMAAVARLRVRTDREAAIDGCSAELAFLEKDGVRMMSGSHLAILFAPGSDSDSRYKTVYHKDPQHLEVLWLASDGSATIITNSFPHAFKELKVLDRKSRYSFHITLFGEEILPIDKILDVAVEGEKWKLRLRQPS